MGSNDTMARHVRLQVCTVGGVWAMLWAATCLAAEVPQAWPVERARGWADRTGWLVGCNYVPATAINQLEMWQAETFDPERIELELGWAESLGFNSLRVFLHDIPYRTDAAGFLDRIDRFLEIADRHRIGVMFVLFDSVWDPFPQPGPQRPPRPGVHNSGWVQSPGREILGDESRQESLAPYVREVVGRFKDDPRVQAWDIINEPDNRNDAAYGSVELRDKAAAALVLTKKAFRWAREAGPSQPLTAAVWLTTWKDPAALKPTEEFCLAESDVVSFHHYGRPETFRQCVANLRRYDRPEAGRRVRLQLGLRGRQVADHLPLGLVEEAVRQGARSLVPRHLSHRRHAVPGGGGRVHPLRDRRGRRPLSTVPGLRRPLAPAWMTHPTVGYGSHGP